jgi:hypothetical protein
MARGGARSLQQTLMVFVIIALVGGAAFGVWSLRPTPGYASEDVLAGSPFDVTFRAENTNPLISLSNVKLSCVLAHVRASPIPPTLIEATDVRFPAGNARLAPGEAVTFRCPFRAALGHSINDDSGIATRAEIFFRSAYDLDLFGGIPLRDDSTRYFLNTRLLPPRWTSRAQE